MAASKSERIINRIKKELISFAATGDGPDDRELKNYLDFLGILLVICKEKEGDILWAEI